jgi:hypothetical protein
MTHYSRLYKAVIDVPEGDHDKELTFWQEATGQTLTRGQRYPEYHGSSLPGDAFALLIQRIGTGPARVHLDIHTDDLEAEITRLEALGARRLRLVDDHWWIMQDPAGLPFCVLPELPGSLDDHNAQRWDGLRSLTRNGRERTTPGLAAEHGTKMSQLRPVWRYSASVKAAWVWS